MNAVRAEAKEGESPSMDLMSSLAAIRSAHGAKDDDTCVSMGGTAMGKSEAKGGAEDKASGGGEDAKAEAKKAEKQFASSTSSLYLRSTLQVPDVDRLLLSISMLLEQLIIPERLDYDVFSLHAEPSCAEVDMESIFSFMKEAFNIAMWSPECNIIAMVLISRLTASTEVSLNLNNWDKVILCSMLLAQKLWDDIPLSNTDFPLLWQQAFPGSTAQEVDLQEVNRMERLFLELLHYDVNVTRATYTQFYFELHSLSQTATETKAIVPILNEDSAAALEMRASCFTNQVRAMSLQSRFSPVTARPSSQPSSSSQPPHLHHTQI